MATWDPRRLIGCTLTDISVDRDKAVLTFKATTLTIEPDFVADPGKEPSAVLRVQVEAPCVFSITLRPEGA